MRRAYQFQPVVGLNEKAKAGITGVAPTAGKLVVGAIWNGKRD